VDKIAEIRRKKAATYQDLRALFEGLNEADWGRPAQGHRDGWTVRDLLAHLVAAGAGLLRVAQLIADGRLNMPPDFDLDRWNRRQIEKQEERTNAQLLDGLDMQQRDVLAYLDALAADDGAAVLSRRGRHAIFGETTVEYILRRIYRHEWEHTAELRQALDG
jgi:uncharacterized protein (TIGR03083 family)